ncbi:ricin-type beta-trefoil lectin domain protein [Fodinicola feengrottensis]|uniref:ricin-type beta-trefoil lectin domain protein n=1 Tax=Fodinicola feengrottensis TaxID=435914 RepID=UPI0024421ED8|nr:ricin-type beta-trefoil lectin domain protein [Fodinicola feengrottensis]
MKKALMLLPAVFVAVALTPAAAVAATGTITGLGGKCVDVASASSANGTAVQLYDCNGTSAQSWTVGTDGTIRALGKCMDVAAANSANGTKIQLYDCNGSSAQSWTIGADGTIRGLGKCLDATNNSSANAINYRSGTARAAPTRNGPRRPAAAPLPHRPTPRWRSRPTTTTAGAARPTRGR